MITIAYAIDNKIPVNKVLTREQKDAIIAENKDADVSYLSLLKEMCRYETTVGDILRGWGGVKLVSLNKGTAPRLKK